MIPGKDILNFIIQITPYWKPIRPPISTIIESNSFIFVQKFNIETLLNTDPDFKDYVNSKEKRYLPCEMNEDQLEYTIIVADGKLVDGYSRCEELLYRNITETSAYLKI